MLLDRGGSDDGPRVEVPPRSSSACRPRRLRDAENTGPAARSQPGNASDGPEGDAARRMPPGGWGPGPGRSCRVQPLMSMEPPSATPVAASRRSACRLYNWNGPLDSGRGVGVSGPVVGPVAGGAGSPSKPMPRLMSLRTVPPTSRSRPPLRVVRSTRSAHGADRRRRSGFRRRRGGGHAGRARRSHAVGRGGLEGDGSGGIHALGSIRKATAPIQVRRGYAKDRFSW